MQSIIKELDDGCKTPEVSIETIMLSFKRRSLCLRIFPDKTSITLIDFIKTVSCLAGGTNCSMGHKIAKTTSKNEKSRMPEKILNILNVALLITL
ncbi:MAG: hypothetical protein Q8S11_10885 [Daejeonella sp.]|uniref:hypothetical protein n=1 Tax=Daejeonella sp. TaxID=2805397 RepID=UPI00273329BD|nr:hypothetical protein [Daejeonella sp.]MDP3468830.1 hypothetical protein [Daejeonella sp.]